MITHTIRKNRESLIQRGFRKVGEMFILGDSPDVEHPPNKFQRISDLRRNTPGTPFVWGKYKYAQYLAANVYNKYTKGMQVTLRMYPIVLGKIPPLHIVDSFQEIHYMANWDAILDEPKSIGISLSGGFIQYVAPSSLRKLSEEEQRLVDVSDQETQIHKGD